MVKLPSVKQAFAIHLIVSIIVFLILLYLMMRVWFPGELFYIDGGWQGLKIIAPVDLVLGPALTLLLYRPWKKRKTLVFDISVIAAIQVAALGYGVHSAYNQRTAAIVFASDARFETVSLNEIRAANKELEAMDLQPKHVADLGKMPAVVYATPYEDFAQYFEDVLNGMPELRERSDLFVPIDLALDDIEQYRVSIGEDGDIVEIPASSAAQPLDKNMKQFKLKARYGQGVITFNGKAFEIEQIGH